MTKQEIEQAKKIGLLWIELAEKGTWFELRQPSMEYMKATNSPDKQTSNLDDWRVADKPMKKIDMNNIVGGDIDMEFSVSDNNWFVDKLHKIMGEKKYQFLDKHKNDWSHYRIRQNHWHSWQGGECPLPEGLEVELTFRAGRSNRRYVSNYKDMQWSNTGGTHNVIAFKIIGPADGWEY